MKNDISKFNILVYVIVFVFVAGLIVSLGIISTKSFLNSSIATERSGNITVSNEVNYMNGSLNYFDVGATATKNPSCAITVLWNTTGYETINSNNYSISNCRVTLTDDMYNNSQWSANYSYIYDIYYAELNNTAQGINDGMEGATDFFPVFIVIAGVIVLIILIALIVMSLRGTDLMP